MTTKKVFSASDAAPAVLYAKQNADSEIAYPILVSSFGGLLISQGFDLPEHDQQVIDEADPNNIVITYKLAGATVATKTIAIVGTTTTITVA